jgi:hypothetical protein
MAFADLIRRPEPFMKPNIWLLMTVVVCGWLTNNECLGARGGAGVHLAELFHAQLHFHNSGRYTSGLQHSRSVHCSETSWVNSQATDLASRCLPRFAEMPLDDRDQADESQSDDADMEFMFAQICLPAIEWRLSLPVALDFDSFINSKSRPPP